MSFASALAMGASLLGAAPALADGVPGSLSPLGCVGVSGSANNGPSACATELPAGLANVYQAVVSPDGRNVYEAVLGNEIAEYSRDPSTGTLSPLTSPTDCIAAPDGGLTTAQCAQQTASGLNGVAALAISPDGKDLYAIGQDDNAVVAFSRDPSTGALTQLPGDSACTAETSDASSSCSNQTGYGLENAYAITVSPDGRNVYVASYGDHAVAEFHRDPSTGTLTQFACQSDSSFTDGYCTATADGLERAIGVAVSADGQNVYVAAGSTGGNGDIAEFSRDTSVPPSSPDYGLLTQLPYPHDCITGAGDLDPSVQCGDAAAIGVNGPEDLVLSPDGRSLYANSFDANAVLEFSRNPSTGVLAQLPAPNDCISSDGASGCGTTNAPSLQGPLGVAISPDGFDLYVADASANAVTTLARDPTSGALAPLASPDDCITVNSGGCGTNNVPGLTGARRVTVSPDGTDVYLAAQAAPAIVELARTLPSADLGISQSGAPAAAGVGDSLEYHYTVTNSGPSDAADAMVSVQLAAGTVLDWADASQGSCAGTTTVVCDLGLLRSGHTATVALKVELPSAGTFAATATVVDGTDVVDPNSANDSVLTSTAVGMGTGTGLYVTQRDQGASANVASFALGSFDASLSAPAFAGSGGAASFGIAVTPDGAHVYVTNDNGGSSLSQYSVDPSTGTLTPLSPATVTVSQTAGAEPEDVAVDPTGRWVYVANPSGSSVSQLRINPATGALTMVSEFTSATPGFPAITFPTGVAFSPDGRSLYVADFGAGNVLEFNVDPNTGALSPKTAALVAVPEPSDSSTPQPRRLVTAAVAGSDYLYVSDYANAQVDEFTIDPGTGELTAGAGVASDSAPTGLAVDTATTPASLYVAAEGAGAVDEYDIAATSGALSPKASASIPAGSGPDGVALAPDSQELYVGDSGDGNLNLYAIAADGTLAADPTSPQVAAGSGPSTPVLHTLPAPALPPPTPTGGALTQLAAPNDCLTGNPLGCNTLTSSSLSADYQALVSPDGKNVYAAAYLGMLVEFSRDPSSGALSELGCVGDGTGVCSNDGAAGSNNPRAIALSANGDYLYEVTADNSLVEFSRDRASGLLTWLGCLSSTDSGCTSANGLDAPNGVAVSPDGTSVYVTSGNDSSVAWFTRDPSTGLLTQPPGPGNCLSSDNESNPAGCAIDTATGLSSPITVVVSPDSRNVYVSAGGLGPSGDVAEFSRDPSTGALTQLAPPNDCLASLGTADCGDTSAAGFGGEEDIAISPDGRNVYLNSFSNSAVIELGRNSSTGALEPLPAPNGCITSDSSNPGGCGNTSATALNGVQGVAVSPDGLDVYASSSGPVANGGAFNAVDELHRNPITGALTQAAAPFACLTENGSGCSTYNANGLGQPRRLTVSPDGANVYVAGQEGTLVELARTPPSTDLSIEQNGAAAGVNVGDQVTYTYTIRNLGPSAADDPLVSVPLASEESLALDSSSQGGCSGSAPVRCDLGPLAAGGVATVTVTANANTSGTASVDATVADGTDVTDPDTSNNDVTTSTAISELAPSNTASPEISGTPSAGQTLTASTGSWTGSPGSFSYDWQDCSEHSGNGCATVQSGSSDQYTLAAADEGSFVAVVVTATNGTGNGTATSATVGPVTGSPVDSVLPSIGGSEIAGHTLTASPGSWSGYPAPSFTYDWQDCPDNSGNGCSTVQSGSSDQYTLGGSDAGSLMRVVVAASNGVGSDATATSAFTSAVTQSPANTALPSIAGTASAGQILTASPGAWAGYPAPSFSYTWQDCPDNTGTGCSTVQSGASSQYSLHASDEGLFFRVVVTASNGVAPDGSATSALVGQVTGSPANTSPPTISGTASAGQTLSAAPGGWSGNPVPGFNYAWQDCPDNTGSGCSTVQSGASAQYTLHASDEGSLVRLVVTASNGIGSNATATSAFTGTVTGAPANSAPPTISGTASAGQTLSAAPGGWSGNPAPSYTYAWQDCPDSTGNGCSTVQSGSSSQYSVASADEGSRVRVVVTAANGVGSNATAASATTGTVTGAPANTALPTISGTASQGQALAASPGTWSGNPAPTYTYKWQDCPDNTGNSCSAVQSGASNHYTLLASDEGSLVRVIVTATNSVNHSSATSAFTAAVTGPPVNTAPPAVTGTATAGQSLHASTGSWSGYPVPSFSYTWQDCPDSTGSGCSTINGAASSAYVLATSDEGATVRVIVKASNGVGSPVSAGSATTAAVTGAPVNSVLPSVSGTASAGQTLTVTPGTWTGDPAPSFSYAWKDCPDNSGNGCSTVQSGSSLQYTLHASDEGSLVRVVVTASNGVGPNVTATSAFTAAVTGQPANSVLPSIAGIATIAQTLTASPGTWGGYPAPSYAYAWQDCAASSGTGCSTVQSGPSDQYLLSASDAGLFVRVVVTASNGVGSNAIATSATTAAITAPPANSQAPTVSGTAQQGVSLSGSAGTWSGFPAPSFSYQWEDCDSGANNCVAVAANGNSLSYTPTTADVGKALVLSVTATNTAGHSTAASVATAPVLIAPPADSVPPAVTGTVEQGDALSASTGTWTNSPTSFTYAWMRCDIAGNNCAPITGATASSYVASGADVGSTLRVTVTASNAGGPGSATSAPTAAVLIAPPVPTLLPLISGTTGQGQLLSVSNGLWMNAPTNFGYQWQLCDASGNNCGNVSGASTGNYVVAPGDVGHTLRVVVTAYNAGGNNSVTSAPSAVIGTMPVNTGLPAVSGVTQQGQALTTTNGTWSGTPAPTFTYAWERCDSVGSSCAAISGATASGYTPVVADVGHALRAAVTATNTAGSATSTSSATAPIVIAAPVNSATPALSGAAQPGQTLAASNGTWGNSPSAYIYQWSQCDGSGNACSPIAGAMSPNYVAGPGDVGHTLRVTVTASNTGGSAQAVSAQSQVVSSAAPANTSPPSISGAAHPGKTLTAANGNWGNSPSSFGYQWLQCDASGNACSGISGATASAYTPAPGDIGHTLRVTVTAVNSSGATPATSAQTATVTIAPPANTAPPSISGTAQQGQELSLSNGTWANSPTSFAYQWLRCDAAGANCSAVAGATGNKYVPAAADGGHTLRASVTASNAGGGTAATSGKTATVGSLQVSVAAPILGKTTNLAPVSGTVLVRLPGSSTFTKLTGAVDLPLGSTIDARQGKVTLTVGLPHGLTQTGEFYDGEFVLTQTSTGMTVLTLAGGSFAGCPAPSPSGTTNGGPSSGATATGGTTSNGALASSAKKKPTTVVRQLWGNAHGQYTTKGRYGSAAVSGTIWLTQDRCDGTYIKVTKDNVIAVAYAHPHTKHNIKQGHHILIPAPVH